MPPHTGIHECPPPKKNLTIYGITGHYRVRVTDPVVFVQPTHAGWHLVHNSNLGCELVLHQVGCQVPTDKPNTCSEQTDNQTNRQTDGQTNKTGRRTDRRTDRQTRQADKQERQMKMDRRTGREGNNVVPLSYIIRQD